MATFTVILKRNMKIGDRVWTHDTRLAAESRAYALCHLHSLSCPSEDEATSTFTVDASKYYRDAKPLWAKTSPINWRASAMTIKSLKVTFHGIDAPDYFPGHGIGLTKYTDCATGVGDTEYDAIHDAMEGLCQQGIDMDTPEARDMLDRELHATSGRDLEKFEGLAQFDNAHMYCEHAVEDTEECDMQFYVSIDVEVIP